MPFLPKKKVIVPLDFSDAAFEAVDIALELAGGDSSQVHLVHVLPDLTPMEPTDAWQTFDNQSRITHATKVLRERLTDERHSKMPIEIIIGDPGHSIANFASEIGADLIVLPSHGRTGLSRMLIGSVAERVVRLAHCPVLVLRR